MQMHCFRCVFWQRRSFRDEAPAEVITFHVQQPDYQVLSFAAIPAQFLYTTPSHLVCVNSGYQVLISTDKG
jgi:hypothetical protein